MQPRTRLLVRGMVFAAFVHAIAGLAQTLPALSHPFVPMFTQVETSEAKRVSHLAPAEQEKLLDRASKWYVHFHTEHSNDFPLGDMTKGSAAKTLGERLLEKGVWVTSYRNGSYVSQAVAGDINAREAEDVERKIPLAIATWWPGHRSEQEGSDSDPAARLTQAVDTSSTTLRISQAAAHRPKGMPAAWPYLASRGTGAAPGQTYTQNSHDLVGWVRLGNEVLRVRDVNAGEETVALTVDRGYFGTKAAAHARGDRVFLPVYVGAASAITFDKGLSGSPTVDAAGKPLRYALKGWTAEAGAWIAGRIKATFGAGKPAPYLQGYNGVWLDILSCAAYNNADGWGQVVWPWDDPRQTVLTADHLGEYQLRKIENLKREFSGTAGYPPLIWTGNNFGSRPAVDACLDHMMDARALNGYVLEYWMQEAGRWRELMAQNFRIQKNQWPAIYWAKWNQLRGDLNIAQYKRFSYGSLLLAWRPGNSAAQYGGPFGMRKPDALYFYDWGAPVRGADGVPDLEKQTCGGVEIYGRAYQNGVIWVNPADQPASCALPGELQDVSRDEPHATRTLTVGARDAVFLMNGKTS